MKAVVRAAARARPSASTSTLLVHAARPATSPLRSAVVSPKSSFAAFSTSTSRYAVAPEPEPNPKAKEEPKKEKEPEPDSTVAGRSPFQAFVDVLREEVRKNREWQENIQQLQGEVTKAQDSAAMKRAKDTYERARLQASIENNPRLKAAAEQLKRSGISVNDAISSTFKSIEENPLVRGATRAISASAQAAGRAAMTASEPIRKTEAYKAVASEITEAIDNAANNVQHGGYIQREERRRRREARLIKLGKSAGLAARRPKVEENLEAGEAISLHATANIEKKSRFASITPQPVQEAFASLNSAYQESENPFVSTLRSVTNAVGRFFDETETAKVTKWVKEMDPAFTTEDFLRDLREYIVPEIVDAYVNGDQATLKIWTSEATYNVLMATLQGSIAPTLISESRVLDIRNLDIMSAKVLENDVNVFVVAWRTQEVLAYRDIKTGEITVGNENKIEQVGYVAVLTRIEEELENKVTGGWKIIDMARRAG